MDNRRPHDAALHHARGAEAEKSRRQPEAPGTNITASRHMTQAEKDDQMAQLQMADLGTRRAEKITAAESRRDDTPAMSSAEYEKRRLYNVEGTPEHAAAQARKHELSAWNSIQHVLKHDGTSDGRKDIDDGNGRLFDRKSAQAKVLQATAQEPDRPEPTPNRGSRGGRMLSGGRGGGVAGTRGRHDSFPLHHDPSSGIAPTTSPSKRGQYRGSFRPRARSSGGQATGRISAESTTRSGTVFRNLEHQNLDLTASSRSNQAQQHRARRAHRPASRRKVVPTRCKETVLTSSRPLLPTGPLASQSAFMTTHKTNLVPSSKDEIVPTSEEQRFLPPRSTPAQISEYMMPPIIEEAHRADSEAEPEILFSVEIDSAPVGIRVPTPPPLGSTTRTSNLPVVSYTNDLFELDWHDEEVLQEREGAEPTAEILSITWSNSEVNSLDKDIDTENPNPETAQPTEDLATGNTASTALGALDQQPIIGNDEAQNPQDILAQLLALPICASSPELIRAIAELQTKITAQVRLGSNTDKKETSTTSRSQTQHCSRDSEDSTPNYTTPQELDETRIVGFQPTILAHEPRKQAESSTAGDDALSKALQQLNLSNEGPAHSTEAISRSKISEEKTQQKGKARREHRMKEMLSDTPAGLPSLESNKSIRLHPRDDDKVILHNPIKVQKKEEENSPFNLITSGIPRPAEASDSQLGLSTMKLNDRDTRVMVPAQAYATMANESSEELLAVELSLPLARGEARSTSTLDLVYKSGAARVSLAATQPLHRSSLQVRESPNLPENATTLQYAQNSVSSPAPTITHDLGHFESKGLIAEPSASTAVLSGPNLTVTPTAFSSGMKASRWGYPSKDSHADDIQDLRNITSAPAIESRSRIETKETRGLGLRKGEPAIGDMTDLFRSYVHPKNKPATQVPSWLLQARSSEPQQTPSEVIRTSHGQRPVLEVVPNLVDNSQLRTSLETKHLRADSMSSDASTKRNKDPWKQARQRSP